MGQSFTTGVAYERVCASARDFFNEHCRELGVVATDSYMQPDGHGGYEKNSHGDEHGTARHQGRSPSRFPVGHSAEVLKVPGEVGSLVGKSHDRLK